MRDHADLTRRLADLVVQFGANVQPGQLLGITSYIGKEELTREIARAAYDAYVTKDGLMFAQVTTFRSDEIKMKK